MYATQRKQNLTLPLPSQSKPLGRTQGLGSTDATLQHAMPRVWEAQSGRKSL